MKRWMVLLNQLLREMNQILQEKETEWGRPFSLEEWIEGVRQERGEILKEKYAIDTGNE